MNYALKKMNYSIIVPVYNRPDEVDELLQSLTAQTEKDFEVVVVEDGSTLTCEDVCKQYAGILDLHYYDKPNSGPGQSRNYGAERARGDYLIILDSDVVLPVDYLSNIKRHLAEGTDAFGGPDRAHPSFTPIQKAISYSMTSFFTTGGIRGGTSNTSKPKRKALDKFYPRSFNMGIRADVYKRLGGFSKMRFGEDIDFSIRIFKAGCRCRLFPEAWVWHKRRTDFRKFFRQVFNSGIARINLYRKYPESLKAVHLLPAVFTVGTCLMILVAAVGRAMMHYDPANRQTWTLVMAIPLLLLMAYCMMIFVDSAMKNKSAKIGLLSVGAAFVQLMGYGTGFLQAWWLRCVKKKDEFQAFEQTFYK